jgi:hypothetical protein
VAGLAEQDRGTLKKELHKLHEQVQQLLATLAE